MNFEPDEFLDFLRQKYVCRADKRQEEMGLSYLTAEVKDLANELAKFVNRTIEARN